MRQRCGSKILLRFLVVVAVAIAVTVLYGPPSGSNSPYPSALSNVTLGTPAMACPGKRCNLTTNTCVSGHKGTFCIKSGKNCIGTGTC